MTPSRNIDYGRYVDRVNQFKVEKKNDEAIEYLLRLVNSIEKEAQTQGLGAAPWYYEQLAIFYREEERYDDEVAVLERFEALPTVPGGGQRKLAKRLVQARQIRDKKLNT